MLDAVEMALFLNVFPPPHAVDLPVGAADAFDIPVFVRHSSPLRPVRRPMPGSVEAASAPWPPERDVPGSGAYLVTTTWRDILDAAATVGRDPIPWFAAMPELAHAELIARWSPLMAYLRRRRNPWARPGSSGYLIEPNAVYYHGTLPGGTGQLRICLSGWLKAYMQAARPGVCVSRAPAFPGRPGYRWGCGQGRVGRRAGGGPGS